MKSPAGGPYRHEDARPPEVYAFKSNIFLEEVLRGKLHCREQVYQAVFMAFSKEFQAHWLLKAIFSKKKYCAGSCAPIEHFPCLDPTFSWTDDWVEMKHRARPACEILPPLALNWIRLCVEIPNVNTGFRGKLRGHREKHSTFFARTVIPGKNTLKSSTG